MSQKRAHDDDSDRDGAVVLGVHGGATFTRCLCMLTVVKPGDSPDGVVSMAIGKSLNRHSVGEADVLNNLKHVLEEAFRQSRKGTSALRAICVGIPGLDSEAEKESILEWLRLLYPQHVKFLVYNDSIPALATGNLKLFGCALIAGTGATAYGRTKDNQEARSDGWGPLMGDCGSGYWISVQALNAVMKACDGRGVTTKLTKSILELYNRHSPDELFRAVYSDTSRDRIARIAPSVFACAKDGDVTAQMIVMNASLELSETVKSVVKKLSMAGDDGKSPFPLVLVGGLFSMRGEWDLGKMVAEHVKETYTAVEVLRVEADPVFGAAWLARELVHRQPHH